MFSNSSHIVVKGGVFNNIEAKTDPVVGLDKGLEILYSKVATGALYNSGERFDPPKCHPNTRTAILQEILDWLNEPSEPPIPLPTHVNPNEPAHSPTPNQRFSSMWISGPAGAGKSAIAQTIAQSCCDLDLLSSTFFFSRTGGTGRENEKYLVPTLAYGMMKHIPETQPFVSSAVLNDPLVFDLSLESQMQALIVKPLSLASETMSSVSKPRLIVIDGLDECLEAHIQCLVVNTLTKAIGFIQHKISHKLLILSRPEPHLVSLFNERRFHSTLRKLALDNRWQPDDDIRLFLLENIQHIKHNHSLSDLLVNWPKSNDVDELVRRSSGQFVYASTVIKALRSERHHPEEVMKDILSLRRRTKNWIYAELDALYDHIFSKVEDLETVIQILRISLARSLKPPIGLQDPGKVAQAVLGLPNGMLEISLSDLSAVVSVTRTVNQVEIIFFHASLADYLLDESRSGRYFINSEDVCVNLCRRCMNFMTEEKSDSSRNLDSLTAYHLRMAFSGPIHFANHVHDRRIDIHRMFSEMDLGFFLSLAAGKAAFRVVVFLADITEFIVWGLQEYKTASGSTRAYLSKFVKNFQHWIFARLERFPFNGFDNELGLDLTVFAMSPTSFLRTVTSKGSFNNMIEILADVIQTNMTTIEIPQELVNDLSLCWSLMPGISMFFEDPELAGRYTITPKRYCDAAVLCFSYFLRGEPSRIRRGDAKRVLTTQYYLQAMKYANFFLKGAEPRVDLYDLCRKLVDVTTVEGKDVVLDFNDEDKLHSLYFGNISRLINRPRERTDGKESPWTYHVEFSHSFSMSIVRYLLKTYQYQSSSLSRNSGNFDEPVGFDTHPKSILATNNFGENPWWQNTSTMRWFWWNERNILRWIPY